MIPPAVPRHDQPRVRTNQNASLLQILKFMKQNLGLIDRALRIALGIALVVYGIFNHSWIGALGAIPLLTAAIGFCPLYCPIGLSTKGKPGGGSGCGGGKCS